MTQLLTRMRAGDAQARERLMHQLYDTLRDIARAQRFRIGARETLNTTALLHEAYEKLAGYETEWADRRHFLRVAARVMRQVLMDDIRRRRTDKRGNNAQHFSIEEQWMIPEQRVAEIESLDEALIRLAALDTRQAEIVELRYFVGLTIEETGEVLDLSPATVKREWTAARAWLYQSMAS